VKRDKRIGIPTPVNALLTDTVTALLGDPSQQALWKDNVDKLVSQRLD
jgi:hypothetical protein